MDNFFVTPTDNHSAFTLTTTGIILVAALITALLITALLLRPKKARTTATATKQLVFSAAAMALGIVTSMFKFLNLPMGGSITLFSMLFIVLIGNWYGPKIGITTAVAYGLLQFVIEPVFYTLPQMLIDYPLAFGALGISGFFYQKKNGLLWGYIAGVLGRYFFSFWSGMVFFGAYAADYNMGAPLYSFLYNGMYLIPEAIITVIVINMAPVKSALARMKQLALEYNRIGSQTL